MMKYKFVAVVNWMISTFFLFASPILTFALPLTHVLYGYLFVLVGLFMVEVIDIWNSDCTMRNVAILRKAGFSRTRIWSYFLFNFFTFQLPGILLAMYCMEDYNPSWDLPTWNHFSIDKIGQVVVMVLSTDVLFFVTHKLLHERLPQIHLFHHCCVYSSQTTNLFFHPIDSALEFSGPTLAVFFMSKFLTNDPSWMFALSTAITYSWYCSDHDEWLASAHTKHHRGCATGYFVYINYFYSDSSKELVRKCLPKLSEQQDALKQVS